MKPFNRGFLPVTAAVFLLSVFTCGAAFYFFMGTARLLTFILFYAATVVTAAFFTALLTLYLYEKRRAGTAAGDKAPSSAAEDAASGTVVAPGRNYPRAVENILTGRLPPKDYLQEYLDENEISFSYNAFTAVIAAPRPEDTDMYWRDFARLNGSSYEEYYLEFVSQLSRLLDGEGSLCNTWMDGTLGVIVNFPIPEGEDAKNKSREMTSRLSSYSASILERMRRAGEKRLMVSVGAVYEDVYFIDYSTTSALGLLDHLSQNTGERDVLTRYDVVGDAFSLSDEHEKMDQEIRFYFYASEKMFGKARDALLSMIDIEQSAYALPISKIGENTISRINHLFMSIGINSTLTHGMPAEFWKNSVISLRCSSTAEMLKSSITDIFTALESDYENDFTRQDGKTRKYLSYIDANYADPNLNVETLCQKFDINPSYLSRLFKKEAGRGPLEYIHLRRIEAAKDLLCTGRKIDEIARACGYCSRRAFDTAFKRESGVTPGEYRAKLQSVSDAGRKAFVDDGFAG